MYIEESDQNNDLSVSSIDISRIPPQQRSQDNFDYMEVINFALKEYEDVNENDVEILEGNSNPFKYLSNSMFNSHRTLVPIGANFQAIVPPIMTIKAYRLKTAQTMRVLKILKINDPEEGQEFYSHYFNLIENRFGPGRTYQDVNHLRNAFKRLNSRLTFEQYLAKNSKYWQTYFKAKDRAMGPKLPLKKKKKKGTIPV